MEKASQVGARERKKTTAPQESTTRRRPQSGSEPSPELARLSSVMNQAPAVQRQRELAEELQSSGPVKSQVGLAQQINREGGGRSAEDGVREKSGPHSEIPSGTPQRKAASSHGKDDTVQLFPYRRYNEKTNRTFLITDDGGTVSVRQIAGDPDDPHSGYASYSIEEGALRLEHIAADPEEGSGIGSILMYFLAHIASLRGLGTMNIGTGAPTAVGFYELFGFKTVAPQAVAKFKEFALHDEDKRQKAEVLHLSTRARIRYDTDPRNRKLVKKSAFSSQKTRRTFGALPHKEQQELILRERKEFEKLDLGTRGQHVEALIHGMAVGATGLTAPTHIVLARAQTLSSRWKEVTPNVWTSEEVHRVRQSAHDLETLTEFPRHPEE
ncbi:MAG: GNAT family N-acetyltransferase [Acidobacteriia bacterium]|nr:GNAT family N-acetyltransferase [Terriglobia bacterium]